MPAPAFVFKSTHRTFYFPLKTLTTKMVVNGQVVEHYLTQSAVFRDFTYATDDPEVAEYMKKSKVHGKDFWFIDGEEESAPVPAPTQEVEGIKTKNDALTYLIKKGATAESLKPLKSKADVAAFALSKYNVIFKDFAKESAE